MRSFPALCGKAFRLMPEMVNIAGLDGLNGQNDENVSCTELLVNDSTFTKSCSNPQIAFDQGGEQGQRSPVVD
jgi:hypothetical protein